MKNGNFFNKYNLQFIIYNLQFTIYNLQFTIFQKISGGIDWRQKLDSQRGAVLANELKNNSCKLAKWTVQAILAHSDQMKFG